VYDVLLGDECRDVAGSALSVRVPGCQKLQMMYGLTWSCTGCFTTAVPITVGVKGLCEQCSAFDISDASR